MTAATVSGDGRTRRAGALAVSVGIRRPGRRHARRRAHPVSRRRPRRNRPAADRGLRSSVSTARSKPCLAVLIARLCDDGLLDLDEPLERLLGGLPVLDGGVSLRHLLTHTAGLARPMAFEMELIPPHERRAVVERMTCPADFRLGVDAAVQRVRRVAARGLDNRVRHRRATPHDTAELARRPRSARDVDRDDGEGISRANDSASV